MERIKKALPRVEFCHAHIYRFTDTYTLMRALKWGTNNSHWSIFAEQDFVLLWLSETKNFRQRKPPGTSKVFLTLLNITGFAQNFFLSIEHPPVAPSTIVPNPRSKKWSKWKMNTTFTLKTFKIMKLLCFIKKKI